MTTRKEVLLPDGRSWGVMSDWGIYVLVDVEQIDGMTPAEIGEAVLRLAPAAGRCRAVELSQQIDYWLTNPDVDEALRLVELLAPYTDDPAVAAAHRKAVSFNELYWSKQAKLYQQPKPGFIYILEAKAQGWYKIGRATNVQRRLKSIELPFPTTVLHTIPSSNTVWAEKHLHRKFAAKRLNGEWFELTPDDVAWICALTALEQGAGDE